MPRHLPRKLRGATDHTAASRPSPRPRPRPHAAHDQPVPSTAATARTRLPAAAARLGLPAASQRTTTVLAAVAVVLAVAAGVLFWQQQRAAAAAQAGDDALAAARTGAQTLFSYDYRTIDDNLAAGRKVVTGRLATDYRDTSAVVKPTAVSTKAVVKATVSEAGVVSAASDRVVVLLYLNQESQNKNTRGTKLDMNRVRLTLVQVDGDWKISRAEPL
jgi:Mce-associated membrane protein